MRIPTIREPRYRAQQAALDEIAAKLGVVAYRPNYHGEPGDKNTVLFYLKDDAEHNRQVDQQPTTYTRGEAADLKEYGGITIPPECVYRDYFWCFQNTDPNGQGSMDFANGGRIDLRGIRWKDALEGAAKLALVQKIQRAYIASTGGYFELREADETYNDMNREQISALKQMHGTAFMGEINFYDDKRQRVIDGTESIYEEVKDQQIYNFSCSFCVPTADKELEKMIREWNQGDSLPKKAKDVEKITGRIEAVGGINLIWY